MGSVNFQFLLDRAARQCGLDPERLATTAAEDLASFLEMRVRDVWVLTQWPGTLLCEERAFAPAYNAGTTYTAGTLVYHAASRAYYAAVQSANTGHAVTDTAWWAVKTDYDRALMLETAGLTPMGEVLGVWREDPRKKKGTARIGYTLFGDSVWLTDPPTTAWIVFRRRPPTFSAKPYEPTTTYAAGETVFQHPHAYQALQQSLNHAPTEIAYWQPQLCPDALADYAVRGARADWLSSDGQDDKASQAEGLARSKLNDRLADLTIHQQQTASYFIA